MRSAARFQLRMVPSRSLLIMASLEDSTTAASRNSSRSERRERGACSVKAGTPGRGGHRWALAEGYGVLHDGQAVPDPQGVSAPCAPFLGLRSLGGSLNTGRKTTGEW